jgi:uncharacterized protein YecE (DUF72 family)
VGSAKLNENVAMAISRDRFLRTLRERLGVARFQVVPSFEGESGIQHIDCLLKLMDEERMLIRARLRDYSRAGLVADRCRLAWRVAGGPGWNYSAASRSGVVNWVGGLGRS